MLPLNIEKERKIMKWLEIIELRSAGSNKALLESQLQNLIKEVNKEAKQQAIKIYSRVIVDTDFSIHLIHNSNKIESGSPLGLRLASALKEYGLVYHSVWIEMYGK